MVAGQKVYVSFMSIKDIKDIKLTMQLSTNYWDKMLYFIWLRGMTLWYQKYQYSIAFPHHSAFSNDSQHLSFSNKKNKFPIFHIFLLFMAKALELKIPYHPYILIFTGTFTIELLIQTRFFPVDILRFPNILDTSLIEKNQNNYILIFVFEIPHILFSRKITFSP